MDACRTRAQALHAASARESIADKVNSRCELQAWLGRKADRRDDVYVHVAVNHRRDILESIVAAAATRSIRIAQILKMLDARGSGFGHPE